MQANELNKAWMSWCSFCANKYNEVSEATLLPQNGGAAPVEQKVVKTELGEEIQVYNNDILVKLFVQLTNFQLAFANTEAFKMCLTCKRRLDQLEHYIKHVNKVQEMYKALLQEHNNENASESWHLTLEKYFNDGIADDAQMSSSSSNENLKYSDILNTINDDPLWVGLKEDTDSCLLHNENEVVTLEKVETMQVAEAIFTDTAPGAQQLCSEELEVFVTEKAKLRKQQLKTNVEVKTYIKKKKPNAQTKIKEENEITADDIKEADCNYLTIESCKKIKDVEKQQRQAQLPKIDATKRTHIPNNTSCNYCGKSYRDRYVLKTHIKSVHLNERPNVCSMCGLGVKGSLKYHMATHVDEPTHECDVCSKLFKSLYALKRHKQVHRSEKYICPFCGLELASSNSLRRHIFIHTDHPEIHKCPYCVQCFNRSEAFRHHLILHSGLKPHACNFCERTFAHVSNGRAHLKKRHAQEWAEYEALGKQAIISSEVPSLERLLEFTQNANTIYPVKSKRLNSASKKLKETVDA